MAVKANVTNTEGRRKNKRVLVEEILFFALLQ